MSSRLSAKAGLAIRKLRLAGGWTLAQLSERSGVPLSTLSKVELGQTSLSYENLLRICKGLEIDMARLIGAEADGVTAAPASATPPMAMGRRAIARSGEGETLILPSGKGRVAGGDLIRKAFTPVTLDIEATTLEGHGGLSRDDGEAYVVVLSGDLAVHSELYAPLHLRTGDGVYFDARAGYALIRQGEAPCRALVVFAGDRHG